MRLGKQDLVFPVFFISGNLCDFVFFEFFVELGIVACFGDLERSFSLRDFEKGSPVEEFIFDKIDVALSRKYFVG